MTREIAIQASDRQKVDDILKFVSGFASELPVEARMVMVVKFLRMFAPEIEELKRQKTVSA